VADDPNRGCSRWKESRLTWLSCFMSPCTQPRSAKSVLVCVLAPHPGTNRVPSVLIGYLTAHTMSSHFDAPARFYSRSAPSTQTPVPDRATSQHPSNSATATSEHKRKQPRTAKLRNPESDQSSKSDSATVSKILVLRAPTTRHLGAPVPRPGTRICRYPVAAALGTAGFC